MPRSHTMGWGMAGAATTILARRATRRALHGPGRAPRLPRAARRHDGFGTMLLLALAAGALLALVDVLQEQRRHVTNGS